MKKFLVAIVKFIVKCIRTCIRTALAFLIAFLIWGCSTTAIVPTVVPPLMDTLIEGDTPHIKLKLSEEGPCLKITTQGIVDARMKYLETMYPVVKKFYDIGKQQSQDIANTVLGLLTAVGLTGTGALPLALKRIPKGAIKEEDHKKAVIEAGKMKPSEFLKKL